MLGYFVGFEFTGDALFEIDRFRRKEGDGGGNWKTIQDESHFQLRPAWASELSERDMLAELRSRKDSGTDAYA